MGIFPDISTATLVAVVLVYLFAGMIKGAFGFGLPLASIALLPLFIPIDMALGVNAGLLPASNIFQFAQGRMMRETVVRFWPLLIGVTVGVAIGAPLAKGVDKQVLTVCLGVLVMAFTVMTRFRPEFHIPTRHERSAGVVAGVLAGFVGALTTSFGIVFATYMVGIRADRRLMVSALGLLFLVSGILVAGSFWLIGFLDPQRLALSIFCLPFTFAGMILGNKLAARLSAEAFRQIILLVLFGLGFYMVFRAIS